MATKTKAGVNGRIDVADLGADPGAPAPQPINRGIVVPALTTVTMHLPITGITPLLMCRFDQKVQSELMAKTEGRAKNKKEAKDPEAEWTAARWISTEGWDGIHAGGIRAAIIDAARSVDGLTMTALKQAIFVRADGRSAEGAPLVRIHGTPAKFSNMCRTTTGVAYPRHRPMYDPWSATLTIEAITHILSEEAVANLVSIAGFTCGLGEWRPTSPKSKTGDFGRFELGPKVTWRTGRA